MSSVSVSAYVRVPSDCRMRGWLEGEDVEFSLGGYREGFEIVFGRESLRRLVHLATEVLAASAPCPSMRNREFVAPPPQHPADPLRPGHGG